MHTFIESMIILPLLVGCFQLYTFSVNSEGEEKQGRCQKLGIAFMTCGIIALVFKTIPLVGFGFILIMIGFRLLAKGLDRLDKSVFIDQCEEDK